MVAALFDKEVVNHEILVLTGRQGIYKTTWLNNLLSPELRRYFYLKSNARRITKDDLLTLAEFAIVCLEELDEMETQEVNQIKALTTMKVVNERAAYAHYKEHRDHIASFCGISNNTHFLADPTGNRRWLPLKWRISTALMTFQWTMPGFTPKHTPYCKTTTITGWKTKRLKP